MIEHYGGRFPLWLSPVQAAILPVSEKFNEYAASVEAMLRSGKVRVESDLSSEKLGYKIRKAQMSQVPYMLIAGEKEVGSRTVSVRHRDRGDLGSSKPEEILKIILEENTNRM